MNLQLSKTYWNISDFFFNRKSTKTLYAAKDWPSFIKMNVSFAEIIFIAYSNTYSLV